MNWIKFKDQLPEIEGQILVRRIAQYGPMWYIPNLREIEWKLLTAYSHETLVGKTFWLERPCWHNSPSLNDILTQEWLITKEYEWVRLPTDPEKEIE